MATVNVVKHFVLSEDELPRFVEREFSAANTSGSVKVIIDDDRGGSGGFRVQTFALIQDRRTGGWLDRRKK